MAFLALAFLRARLKLPLVRIGFVTIYALREYQLSFEVATQMTKNAAHFCVQTEQRILSLRVVEFESRQYFLPTYGGMAGFAALLERSFVRIDVASRAGVKLHILIAGRPPGLIRLVAFLASHLHMQARQRVSRFRMVELRGLLPVVHVVTALAVVSQLPFMRIGVAGQAVRRHPKKGFIQILVFDECLLARNHLRRGVAFLAREPRMLSFEVVSR